MPNIVDDFRRWKQGYVSENPGESEAIAFAGDLSQEGKLLDYDEEDWWKLGQSLDMTDDEIAALIEGTATWIVKEDVPVPEQEPADWPERPEDAAPNPEGDAGSIEVSADNEPAEEEITQEEGVECDCDCNGCDDEGCGSCAMCNEGCACCCCVCEEEEAGEEEEGDDEEHGECECVDDCECGEDCKCTPCGQCAFCKCCCPC